MTSAVIILELIGICIIFVALGLLVSGDGTSEQKITAFFLCGSLIQNVGYMLEITASTLEVAEAAVKFQNLGSGFVPLCYCWFIFLYCYQKPPILLLKGIAVVNFVCIFIIFFNNSVFYSEMHWVETAQGHHYLDIEYGPLYFPVLIVLRLGVPFILSIYALLKAVLQRQDEKDTRQYLVFLFLSLLPVVALLVYILKLTNVYDLSPVTLGLVLSAVEILVWRRRNFDFRRIAAETVIDNMADGVITLDGNKRLVSYNFAAGNMFPALLDYRRGDVLAGVKQNPDDMFLEDSWRRFQWQERFYESHSKQICSKSGVCMGYVFLLLDITDTAVYIEEINKLRMQAEKANIAKSEFLANMSHEIRTPMNAIVGLSDIMMEESRDREMMVHAKDIQSAARNLLAIINDILDLSKVEAGKMELVYNDYYLKNAVGEVVGMMDMAASQKGLLMKYEYDKTLPCRYNGDDVRIRQILVNLLNNAIKFTDDGYVRITVSGTPGENENEMFLKFRIEDTGCGISDEDKEKIFDDFTQVDVRRNHNVEGTGLGLSITKHLIRLMNGSISVESVYGEGAAFTVVIPQKVVDYRTIAETPDVESVAEELACFTARGCKVLVVDDNRINQKVAKGMLAPYDLELQEAQSGKQAIEMVKKTCFDIIFMDHMMPGMDGIEAVRIIRSECGENGTRPVIIALTANAMAGAKEKFLDNGFQDFLAKPLNRKMLNDALRKWIPPDFIEDISEEAGEEPDLQWDPGTIRIEGINAEIAAGNQFGSREEYLDLLDLYCLEGKGKTGLLQQLFVDQNYEAYEVEVHGLKSASANIGAEEFSAMARAHEEAAVRGDVDFIQNEFAHLLFTYTKLMDDIQRFLDETRGIAEEEGTEELSGEELLQRVDEALRLLEGFDSKGCAEIVDGLLKMRLPKEAVLALREVREQLKLYEDDNAEMLLRDLLTILKD